jgi:hypothetical protein
VLDTRAIKECNMRKVKNCAIGFSDVTQGPRSTATTRSVVVKNQGDTTITTGSMEPLIVEKDVSTRRVDTKTTTRIPTRSPGIATAPTSGRLTDAAEVERVSHPTMASSPPKKWIRRVTWPQVFKLSDVDKYDGTSDPTQWLQIYSTAVKAAGGNADVMANYLPIMLTKGCRN